MTKNHISYQQDDGNWTCLVMCNLPSSLTCALNLLNMSPLQLFQSLFILCCFISTPSLSTSSSSCVSIYVTVEDFGDSTADASNWNGVYTLDDTKTSFNASIWTIPSVDSNKWLKYIETHWVLSGQNSELLVYESNVLYPPINETTEWVHEYEVESAHIRLECSSTISPTASPTLSPSTAPVS